MKKTSKNYKKNFRKTKKRNNTKKNKTQKRGGGDYSNFLSFGKKTTVTRNEKTYRKFLNENEINKLTEKLINDYTKYMNDCMEFGWNCDKTIFRRYSYYKQKIYDELKQFTYIVDFHSKYPEISKCLTDKLNTYNDNVENNTVYFQADCIIDNIINKFSRTPINDVPMQEIYNELLQYTK